MKAAESGLIPFLGKRDLEEVMATQLPKEARINREKFDSIATNLAAEFRRRLPRELVKCLTTKPNCSKRQVVWRKLPLPKPTVTLRLLRQKTYEPRTIARGMGENAQGVRLYCV